LSLSKSTENSHSDNFVCGYIAIVGRPNVGKSTLLNRLLGQKVSITTHKPQTTRHRILGIKTIENAQFVYVDTPGIHNKTKSALNRYMNRAATTSIADVDIIIFVVDGVKWTELDELVLDKLEGVDKPVILVINKTDKIKDKDKLLPYMADLTTKFEFTQIIPVSARTGDAIENLEYAIQELLPASSPFFPDDQITDRSERFMAAEFIREKLMRTLGEELPYALTVQIEKFENKGHIKRIYAVIWVSRDSQKGILIGKDGQQLKIVGEQARKDMEQAFDSKVFLQLWVKVKKGWSDDERALKSLGYDDD